MDVYKRQVQEYMKTEDYKHLLVAYIEKAARFAGGEDVYKRQP